MQAQDKGSEKTVLPLRAAQPAKVVPTGQEFFEGGLLRGAETCKKCPAEQYEEWMRTWHAKMEGLATPETVVGDFNNVTPVYKDLEVASLKGPKKRVKITPTVRLTSDGRNYFFTLVDRVDMGNVGQVKMGRLLWIFFTG